jgi:leucyl aminopeptidase (aminopeptidase T)
MIGDADLIENAKVPFDLNAQEGDDILIVTDTKVDPQVWSVINNAARSMGFNSSVALIPPTGTTQGNPPDPIGDAILSTDYCLLITSNAMIHSDFGIEAQRSGVKMQAMEELTIDMLGGPAASADYEKMAEEAKELEQVFNAGERIEVTTPHGTEIEASLEDRNGFGIAGEISHHPGLPEFNTSAFPDGEVSISPIEGTTNGTIVWDVSMHEIGLLDSPIEADVEDGYVTEIRGGREAEKFKSMLESGNNPEVYNIAEIALGINPKAEITGIMRVDKKARGFIHMAVGANNDTGGTVEAPLHIDGMMSEATLKIDGNVISKDGSIVF